MENCPECGGVLFQDKYEIYCSVCGLVVRNVGFVELFPTRYPPQNTAVNHNIGKKDLFYSSQKEIAERRVEYFVSVYTNGLPKPVKERAKNLAKIVLSQGKFDYHYEAIGLACAHAAAEEINRKVIKRDTPSSLKKSAMKILRFLKEKGLYHPALPQEIIAEKIKNICIQNGYDYEKCMELYRKHEKSLSGKRFENVAEIITYLYAAIHRKKPPEITGKKLFRIRREARNLLLKSGEEVFLIETEKKII